MRALLESYGLKCCRLCDMPVERRHRGRPRDYCTRHDSPSTRQGWRRTVRRISLGATCRTCSTAFEPVKVGQQYCSDACRSRQYLDQQMDRRSRLRAYCAECGVQLDSLRLTFCADCRSERVKARNLRKSSARRAAGPPIDRKAVLAARGDKCHLCGRRIDLRLSGKHPKGLHIEHLIPVSMGGTNDLDNLHIAHNRCNIRRGNRGPAQLLIPTGETP